MAIFNAIQGPKINANTIALYKFQNNFLDSQRFRYNLTQNGTVPFVTSPAPPIGKNASAGVFSDANYFSGPAGLRTALSSPGQYFFECYVYFNSLANQPVLVYHTQNGLAWWIQGLSNTSIKIQWGGAICQSATSTITTGVWYYVGGYMFSGSGLSKLWCSPASSISQTPVATLNFNAALGTNTVVGIGRYVPAGSFALNGYMKNVRYSIYNPSIVPTTL